MKKWMATVLVTVAVLVFCGGFVKAAYQPNTPVRVSADRGDSDVTLAVGTDAPMQMFSSVFTADHSITLDTATASNGDHFEIVRNGGGSFSLNIGGLKTIGPNTIASASFIYNGTAWVLTDYSVLQ